MRGKAMVALGRVVLAKRERVIMLEPGEKGLMGTTLRYPYEVRDSKDYFYDSGRESRAKLAEHILSSKEATFDPTLFVDRYEQAVLQLVEKKRVGRRKGFPSIPHSPSADYRADAPSDNPVFLAGRQRIYEMMRKVGVRKDSLCDKTGPFRPRHCHVAMSRARSVSDLGIVRPLRPHSATWSSPQREALGGFGLR